MLNWKLQVPAGLIRFYEQEILQISPDHEDAEHNERKVKEINDKYTEKCIQQISHADFMSLFSLPDQLDEELVIDDACLGVNAMDRLFLNCYDCKNNKLSCFCQVCFKKAHSDQDLEDNKIGGSEREDAKTETQGDASTARLPSYKIHNKHDIRLRQTNGFCKNSFRLFYEKSTQI